MNLLEGFVLLRRPNAGPLWVRPGHVQCLWTHDGTTYVLIGGKEFALSGGEQDNLQLLGEG